MDRYTDEYLSVGADTLTKYDAEPVVVTFDPDPIDDRWTYDHTFVARFPSADATQAWRSDETVISAGSNDCAKRPLKSTTASSSRSSIPRTSRN